MRLRSVVQGRVLPLTTRSLAAFFLCHFFALKQRRRRKAPADALCAGAKSGGPRTSLIADRKQSVDRSRLYSGIEDVG